MTISESGWARKTSGSSITASSPLFQVVVAKAAVAGHIDGQNQQAAAARKRRIHDGFNDGNGHTNFRNALNFLEDFLRETRLAGGDLKLRRARDLVHGR